MAGRKRAPDHPPPATDGPGLDLWIRTSGWAAMLLIALGIILAWHFAPLLADCDTRPEAPSGCHASPFAQKLFYVHVPVAFAAYGAFATLAVASWLHLDRKDPRTDRIAHAAAGPGVLFAGLTLISGMVWGRAEWGVWWRNEDTKLVLTLVMFLFYVGYLVLRDQIADPRRRGRVSAAYALLAFVSVPLSYVAQRVWKSQHPTVFDPGNPDAGIVTPWVQETFIVNTLAFLALALFMVLVRYRTLASETEAVGS